MRHALTIHPRDVRRHLSAATAVALVAAIPVAAVDAANVATFVRQNRQYAVEATQSDVMSAYESIDKPGRLFLTQSGTSASHASQHVPKGTVSMPWKVSATFTLDGPNVSASEISGASGMVGVRITLHAVDADKTADLTPIVAFTIPSRVGNDVTADDGVAVSSDNTSTLVAAAGKPGEDLTFNTYVTANRFSMSSLAVAAVDGDAGQSLPDLTKRAATLVDGLTNVGSQRNRKLISQLEKLRDNEKAIAKQTILTRSKAHEQAFDTYVEAYVGSYTTHLSGSLGNSTQLSAILGTASELNGDTPVAKSVADLANAVNDAYRHIGAADAVDEVIRTIEQRGTSGLVRELGKRAGEEQQRGSKDYSVGQSQLSSAMIPYSMDFTDAYTARLKELGATTGTASEYENQTIADVRAGIKSNEKLKTASDKVSAAMTALADASEHIGQAGAFHQIIVRFADQLDSDDETSDSNAADGFSVLASMRAVSAGRALCAKAEKSRVKAQRKAERVQAKDDAADSSSLVDDKNAISMDDVMSYAGGLRPSFGAAADATSKNVAKVGGVDGSTKKGDSAASDGGSESAGSMPISGYGLSKGEFAPNNGDLIDETVELAAAAEILDGAMQSGLSAGSAKATGIAQYLLAVPIL